MVDQADHHTPSPSTSNVSMDQVWAEMQASLSGVEKLRLNLSKPGPATPTNLKFIFF